MQNAIILERAIKRHMKNLLIPRLRFELRTSRFLCEHLLVKNTELSVFFYSRALCR